jgi:RES domain-containing protein
VITAWRLVDAQFADDVFSGEGSRVYGGRWNKKGYRVVYTAATIALATLELIVTAPRAERLREHVVASCTFPEVLVEEIDPSRLPQNWRNYPPPAALKKIGTAWILSGSSAVLSVPSAVVPQERNYLINPEHEYFRSVDLGPATPFHLDLRLLT